MVKRFDPIVFLAALTILASVMPARLAADEKSHRAAAEEMLKVSEMEKSFSNVIEQSIDVQIKANPQLAPLRPVMIKFMSKHLNFENLKDDLIKLHMNEFTEPELKEITAFYRTPAGKKVIQKSSTLFQKGAELGMKRVQDHSAELEQMIREAIADMSKGSAN